ncbi:fatty acid hydroperoxide lyase, chloroplastic [Amborella trichopoda]|uniref:Allene oxide synthase n=1 Tax=Amborella trichopoda TaxID=13333 RepID=W1PCP2_AMBTC|nr:fatty acid hydroperoxide lyase, chloroplastic [Amborella trichopoda]ERN05484.1 hypothetical protein AMTR_s00007p00254060 [Amborella trichopoda]|eukprot:XP_006843809.1 fatty acid hydroperoxide lyase, chloroplastic [Amborella trichopoda]
MSGKETFPVRSIPGSYGLPVIGNLMDRLDYFRLEGPDKFFRNRMAKYQSTVFRANVPASAPLFGGSDPKVIAIVDSAAFTTLFDVSLVEKKDVLVGDYLPSLNYTGGMRVLAYLDPSEPQHSSIKSFLMHNLRRSSKTWVPELQSSLEPLWSTLEKDVEDKGKVKVLLPLQKFLFSFLSKVLLGADPAVDPEIAKNGHCIIDKWLASMLVPTLGTGGVIPYPFEELLLHSFPFPFALVRGDYEKLHGFILNHAKEVLSIGINEYGLTEAHAAHNLLYALGFNAFGGFSIFLPSLISYIGKDPGLQERLCSEVRDVMNAHEGMSFNAVSEMELLSSTVYEALRMNPPVPFQYGRARRDFNLKSHDCAYRVQAGELLCGFQPLAMRDPRVFEAPEEFRADRFTKERGGEALIQYVYWSNGPQTATPSVENKQCAGKDYVVATTRLILADLFMRYDSFQLDKDSSSTITSLKRRS